jgi:putative endonuclease
MGSNPTRIQIMFFTYILKSQKDDRFYYGSTNDLQKRLSAHNKGEARATKGRRPLILHYYESFETRSEAFRREHFFKSIDGYLWLKENRII